MNFIKVKELGNFKSDDGIRYLNINHIIDFGDLTEKEGAWILRVHPDINMPRHNQIISVSETASKIKKLIEQSGGKIAE